MSTASRSAARRLPAAAGLLFTLIGQIHVPPAGEAVLEVPLALAVAQQDEGPHSAEGVPCLGGL